MDEGGRSTKGNENEGEAGTWWPGIYSHEEEGRMKRSGESEG